METERLFTSVKVIDDLQIDVITSIKGVRDILINKSLGETNSKNLTKLRTDDPYLFGVFEQLEEYFNQVRKEFELPLDIIGTEFQKKVWGELLKIKYGETISYKELSIRIGDVKSIRAVANANGANPLPIVIPCHRVIGSDGGLVGYGGGLEVKEKLLELEGSLSPRLF